MSKPGTSFVCCVESGWLEPGTVWLVESLRRFGGRYAAAPIVAVTPRLGPPLSAATKAAFAKWDVKHIRPRLANAYPWFNFFNKPLALVAAEGHIDTEAIGFLDSDLLVVREPDELELAPGEDFLSFPVHCKEMGTTGPGDPYEGLWRASCRLAGLDIEELPWMVTAQTHERVRLYFNSGLFIYRRGSGLAAEYLRLCRLLLDSRIGTRAAGYGLGFKEMVSVGLAVLTLRLKWRALSYSHNYSVSRLTYDQWYAPEALRDARIVHYHDSMWPHFWPTFLASLQATQPQVAAWLRPLGPMRVTAPPHYRALSALLKAARRRRGERYLAHCIPQ